MQSIGFMSLLQGTVYEAQVTFAPTTTGGDSKSGAGSPQQSSQLAGMPTVQHGSGSDSVSDSSSDGAGGPSDHKQRLRAEILNRINLKNLKRGATTNVTPCKPAKVAKVSHSRNDRSNGNGTTARITGSVLVTSVPAGINLGSQVAGGYGSTQVLAPIAAGQLFADLSLKKEVMIPESVKALGDFTQPLTPLTPAASDRSDSPATDGMTKLTVNCSGTSLLPLGLLTPENSPTWEECTTILGSQTEQQVPTLSDLDDTLQLAESETAEVTMLKPSEIKTEKNDVDAVCHLPELDTIVIEKYFEAVHRKKVDIKSEPMSPPQSSVGSPSPVPSPCSSYTESVASPASSVVYASSVEMSPASQVAMSPALSQCNTKVPSPVVQPATVPQQQPFSKETAEGLPEMSDAQLNTLVNSVTEALLDMVKQNGNQGIAAATTADVTGGFVLIPGNGGNKTDDLPVEVPDVEMVESPMSDDSPIPDPIAEAALIDELHQLDQLTKATPSYGKYFSQINY